MTAPTGDDDTQLPREADVRILGGLPDVLESAAVTAVVVGALSELAEENGRLEGRSRSAWQRSQRSVRAPIRVGPGEWRGFSG